MFLVGRIGPFSAWRGSLVGLGMQRGLNNIGAAAEGTGWAF